MEETFTMDDGTRVEFYSGLSYSGITAYVHTKLDKDQRAAFKRELSHERDVVGIQYDN